MDPDELGKGNAIFMVHASIMMAKDRKFEEMLYTAETTNKRARYDGLHKADPPLGYLFSDPQCAKKLREELSKDKMLFKRFSVTVQTDIADIFDESFADDPTRISIPCDERNGKIGLEIFGYALGMPSCEAVSDPLALPPGTFLERLALVKYER
jgi:hypothetical protein